MRLRIKHRTVYHYQGTVEENFNEVRLEPRQRMGQQVLFFEIEVSPSVRVFDYVDGFGSVVRHFVVRQPHTELEITTQVLVDTATIFPVDAGLDDEKVTMPEEQKFSPRLLDYLLPSPFIPFTPSLRSLLQKLDPRDSGPWTPRLIKQLTHAVSENFSYVPGSTGPDSDVQEILEKGKGVCQDLAHVLVGLARLYGFPARYVSGYLFPGKRETELKGTEGTHAWVEIYLPGHQFNRWIAVDPTNDLLADEWYVRVGVGRDYGDVTPIRGVYTPKVESEQRIEVSVAKEDGTM